MRSNPVIQDECYRFAARRAVTRLHDIIERPRLQLHRNQFAGDVEREK